MIVCLAAGSCQPVLGGVDVGAAQQKPEQKSGSEGRSTTGLPLDPFPSLSPGAPLEVVPANPMLGAVLPQLDAGQPASSDAGSPESPSMSAEPDAGPPLPAPRSAIVEGPANELERVGIVGGQPRLGACQGGVAIGVQPTANPSLEAFGQRLTFIEPICGKVSIESSGSSPASLSVARDDSILTWEVTAPFLGPPSTEVPDPRLTWVVQPETLCPSAAPVLVGLSGELDPIAPDDTDTDALRSLVIECAPLVVASNGIDIAAAAAGHLLIAQADSFGISGTVSYQSACQGGSVVTQIHLDSGFWLDGFVLGCSRLRSP
jgi:hypothetical protein